MINTQLLKKYGFIVCQSKQLANKPLARTLLDTHLVLFRTQTGVAALLDNCPHRNAPLSLGKVRDHHIECPYHGWKFDQSGICKRVPGLCQSIVNNSCIVPSFMAKEQDNFIWVCLEPSEMSIPYHAFHLKNSDFNTFIWQTQINAQLDNALENLLDGAHTHFVHAGLIRNDKKRQKVTVTISKQYNQIEACYHDNAKQTGIISQWLEKDRTISYGRFIMPGIAELEYHDRQGISLILTAYFTPISNDLLSIYTLISIRKNRIPAFLQRLVISPFFYFAMQQDKRILRLQQQNIQKQGKTAFLDTEVDIMGSYIRQLLRGESGIEIRSTVELEL